MGLRLRSTPAQTPENRFALIYVGNFLGLIRISSGYRDSGTLRSELSGNGFTQSTRPTCSQAFRLVSGPFDMAHASSAAIVALWYHELPEASDMNRETTLRGIVKVQGSCTE